MSDRCSMFCIKADNCFAYNLDEKHIRCFVDIIINKTISIKSIIDILLEQHECLDNNVIKILMLAENDIDELVLFVRNIEKTVSTK